MVCWYHTYDFPATCHYVQYGGKEWIATEIPANLQTHMTTPEIWWQNQCGLATRGRFLWMGGDNCEIILTQHEKLSFQPNFGHQMVSIKVLPTCLMDWSGQGGLNYQ